MIELLYGGKAMKFYPINVDRLTMVNLIRADMPQVVILEPGDATRYTLLLLPLLSNDRRYVTAHLDEFGISYTSAHEYMFVSRLDVEECPGTWVPFAMEVETWNVLPLGRGNPWSCELIAWWLTEMYKLL